VNDKAESISSARYIILDYYGISSFSQRSNLECWKAFQKIITKLNWFFLIWNDLYWLKDSRNHTLFFLENKEQWRVYYFWNSEKINNDTWFSCWEVILRLINEEKKKSASLNFSKQSLVYALPEIWIFLWSNIPPILLIFLQTKTNPR